MGRREMRLLLQCSLLGLEERVTLLGNVESMESFYEVIDFYLFLTRYEPFGLVIAEAMYAGVPVVGLRGDGEYAESEYPLVDDTTALLRPRTDQFDYAHAPTDFELETLATCLIGLARDRCRLMIMVSNARQRVAARFLSEHQSRRLAAVYRSILSVD